MTRDEFVASLLMLGWRKVVAFDDNGGERLRMYPPRDPSGAYIGAADCYPDRIIMTPSLHEKVSGETRQFIGSVEIWTRKRTYSYADAFEKLLQLTINLRGETIPER